MNELWMNEQMNVLLYLYIRARLADFAKQWHVSVQV